jgi:hypothetical protein
MPLGEFIYGNFLFPRNFKWNAKKRLNKLFIKKLLVFPNFEYKAFSVEKAFFEPISRFYLISNAKAKS